MNIRKNSFFNKLWTYRVGLKQKIRRLQGEKLAKRGIETTAIARMQKVQQKFRDIREVLQNEFRYNFRKGPREISSGTVITVLMAIINACEYRKYRTGQNLTRTFPKIISKFVLQNVPIACKANFSFLIGDRQLKFMLQRPTVLFDMKRSKYPWKELLLYEFLHKKSTNVWKTVTNSACRHCIDKPLKNLRWSYWRLVWRQNCFDMYHWALGRSESFILNSLKIKAAPYP